MQFQVFQYSLPVDDGGMDELNRFLDRHRITTASQSVVIRNGEPMLLFVVEYLKSPVAESRESRSSSAKPAEDFEARLGGEGYAIFNRLRDQRKDIAEKEGVRVYNVFNNAQLAEMIEKKASTEAELANIEGVGKLKLERYGIAFLESLKKEFEAGAKETKSEAPKSGKNKAESAKTEETPF